MGKWLVALILLGLHPAEARGDEALIASDGWGVRSAGPLIVDGGLLLALPTTLGTGLSSGVGLGVTWGHLLAWEARASWSSVTESSIPWTVTQDDVRLRGGVAIQRDVGRARLGLRFGMGPTIVYESRTRNQGSRAGLTGTDLQSSATAVLAAGDLEGVVALHVFGPWLLVMNGGPSLAIDSSGNAHGGWLTQIGIGWQP